MEKFILFRLSVSGDHAEYEIIMLKQVFYINQRYMPAGITNNIISMNFNY